MTSSSSVVVRTHRVIFEGVPIRTSQDILWLRQVMNHLTDWQEPLLHNHIGNGNYNRYPLVQYRAEHERAVLFGVQEGCDLIAQLLDRDDLPTQFLLSRESEQAEHTVEMLDHFQPYQLHRWACLNAPNAAYWQTDLSLSERASFLERLLVGNIFEFCKAVGFSVPDRSLRVRVLDFQELPQSHYPKAGTETNPLYWRNFNVRYAANITLPPYLGLGKGKSKGFGWQLPADSTMIIETRQSQTGRVAFRSGHRKQMSSL